MSPENIANAITQYHLSGDFSLITNILNEDLNNLTITVADVIRDYYRTGDMHPEQSKNFTAMLEILIENNDMKLMHRVFSFYKEQNKLIFVEKIAIDVIIKKIKDRHTIAAFELLLHFGVDVNGYQIYKEGELLSLGPTCIKNINTKTAYEYPQDEFREFPNERFTDLSTNRLRMLCKDNGITEHLLEKDKLPADLSIFIQTINSYTEPTKSLDSQLGLITQAYNATSENTPLTPREFFKWMINPQNQKQVFEFLDSAGDKTSNLLKNLNKLDIILPRQDHKNFQAFKKGYAAKTPTVQSQVREANTFMEILGKLVSLSTAQNMTNANNNQQKPDSGKTPLIALMSSQNLQDPNTLAKMELLLKANHIPENARPETNNTFDLNAKNDDGKTAFEIMIKKEVPKDFTDLSPEMQNNIRRAIELLIHYGAKIPASDATKPKLNQLMITIVASEVTKKYASSITTRPLTGDKRNNYDDDYDDNNNNNFAPATAKRCAK